MLKHDLNAMKRRIRANTTSKMVYIISRKVRANRFAKNLYFHISFVIFIMVFVKILPLFQTSISEKWFIQCSLSSTDRYKMDLELESCFVLLNQTFALADFLSLNIFVGIDLPSDRRCWSTNGRNLQFDFMSNELTFRWLSCIDHMNRWMKRMFERVNFLMNEMFKWMKKYSNEWINVWMNE